MMSTHRISSNKRQNLLTAGFLAVFFLAVIIRIINVSSKAYLGALQTILHIGLLITWSNTIRTRVLHPNIRRFLITVAQLLIVWFLLRGIKYYCFPPGTDIARILWYLYYIPMLLFPVCAMIAVSFIGKPEQAPLGRQHYYPLAISAILAIAVLTNDYHYFVFEFPDNGLVHSDFSYTYNWMFYIVYIWFLVCVISLFIMLFRRCRLPDRNERIIIPAIPIVIGFVYDLFYMMGSVGIFRDIIVVFSGVTICSCELAIRMGLIRSNSLYADILAQSNTSLAIYDENLHAQYAGEHAKELAPEDLRHLVQEGQIIDGNNRYSASKISGGHAVWSDDIGEVLAARERIQSANEYLQGKSTVLNNKYATDLKLHRLEMQNRLFTELQGQSLKCYDEILQFLQALEQTDSKEREGELLLEISMRMVYMKRRNNVILLAKACDRFPLQELEYCLMDIAKNLGAFGISCEVLLDGKSPLSLEEMLRYIDAVQSVVQVTASRRPSYYIALTEAMGVSLPNHISPTKDSYRLTIRLSSMDELPDRSPEDFEVESVDEGEYILIFTPGKGVER